MRNKIESFTKFIHHERVEGANHGTFHMEDNIQYVDYTKLNQYSKKELSHIVRFYVQSNLIGGGWTKSKIINLILSDEKIVNDMKKNNREILLNDLVD